MGTTKRSYTVCDLAKAVASSTTMLQVAHKLGIKGASQNMKKLIADLNLDTSHMHKGVGRHGAKMSQILVENSTFLKTGHLKHKLFDCGLKTPVCESCGITDWMNRRINFHLHHVNGIHTDNRLTNLQILCPNCHSQTENFGVYNTGKGRKRQ